MAAFLTVILLLGSVAFLFQANVQATASGFNQVMQDMLSISQLVQNVDHVNQLVQDLGALPAAEMQEPYLKARGAVQGAAATLPTHVADPGNAVLVRNLRGMVETLTSETDLAVQESQRLERISIAHALEADRIAGYIRDTANQLMVAELTAYSRAYVPLSRRIARANQLVAFLLAAVILLAAVFTGWFARSLNRSLGALVRAAHRIARGDFAPVVLPAPAHAEVAAVAGAMDSMRQDLRRSIEREQLLRGAELRALQAQMEPHFLFNALNMVASTALLEGAEETRTLVEDISDLLRYNLRKPDQPASLRDEVEHAQRYLAVQEARFRGRLRYRVVVEDEAALDLPVPPLTVQPLVENALVHGLASREEGGQVDLRVWTEAAQVLVEVADDGVGMAPEQAGRVLSGEPAPAQGGRSTGLGLYSVRRRLELFFGLPDLLALETGPGTGTRVRLSLPRGGAARVSAALGG